LAIFGKWILDGCLDLRFGTVYICRFGWRWTRLFVVGGSSGREKGEVRYLRGDGRGGIFGTYIMVFISME